MSRVPPIACLLLLVSAIPIRADDGTLFTQQVAPVLRQRCVPCHNPRKSRGGLDLTAAAKLHKGGDRGPAIVPRDGGQSRLILLVAGPDAKMPKQGAKLTAQEVASLRRWIDAGAPWPTGVSLDDQAKKPLVGPDWWSLRPLSRPPLPPVSDKEWVRTPIDRFIQAALQAKGLKPSPAADRRTLIRRVTFDLHGLPPTPEEIEAFVGDSQPGAYERLIDRLLASPRYGERRGRHWLDVVHYGDTHGYDKDKRRDNAWPYRDYVIRALNDDKPYARFIREQIAGDVLYPNDSQAVIATGFVAAGPWDFVGHVELREGTVEKEKTRLLDRDDMVASTIGTFDSMTVHCARCHDHKFDPIAQRDYYRLQAVFAGVDRGDRPYAGTDGQGARLALVKCRQDTASRREGLLRKVAAFGDPELKRTDAALATARAQLAKIALPPGRPSPTNGWHSGIEPKADVAKWVQVDLGRSLAIETVRLVPARPTDFPDTPGFGFPQRFRVAVSDDPTFARSEVLADYTESDHANPGDTAVVVRGGHKGRYVRVTALRLWRRTGDYIFALAELQVMAGGKNAALGVTVTALDSIEAGRWGRKNLVDNFDSRTSLPDPADPKLTELVAERDRLADRLRRLEERRREIVETLTDAATKEELAKSARELAGLDRQLQSLPRSPAVYALTTHPPRPIHILNRGDVEQKRELVGPGALACVPGLQPEFRLANPNDEGQRRAALADWIADPKNVLTWRSIVNRVWHYHFGRGLVDTPNDFGYNGGRPSHPELLDWLAIEFREGGGSLKQLHRLILLSAAYQQSSQNDTEAARVDADNRTLWRANRTRLDAEEVRDAVLAVSGRLDPRMGGPGYEPFRFRDDHSPEYDHTALESHSRSGHLPPYRLSLCGPQRAESVPRMPGRRRSQLEHAGTEHYRDGPASAGPAERPVHGAPVGIPGGPAERRPAEADHVGLPAGVRPGPQSGRGRNPERLCQEAWTGQRLPAALQRQ